MFTPVPCRKTLFSFLTCVLPVAVACLALPPMAAGQVTIDLTPSEASIGLGQGQDFTAVVTGTAHKDVKWEVCRGSARNCLAGGNRKRGGIVEVGRDADDNPIARYVAPTIVPEAPTCTLLLEGCQITIRATLVRFPKKATLAPVLITFPAGVIALVTRPRSHKLMFGGGGEPSVNADGRLVAFVSAGSKLVPGDTNEINDVFVRDTCVGAAPGCVPQTIRASVAEDGSEIKDYPGSMGASLSSDGRFVAFWSDSANVVTGDTNGVSDIFIRDTCFFPDSPFLVPPPYCEPATARVSLANDGSEADAENSHPSISVGGRYVAFESLASNLVSDDTSDGVDIFVRDTCLNAPPGCTPATLRISVASDGTQANNSSGSPVISADGRFVAFESVASNLVPGDTNNRQDVFVRDTCLGAPAGCIPQTTLVSVANDGFLPNGNSLYPSITADGRFIAFESVATNLVADDTNAGPDIFVRDTCRGAPLNCVPSTIRVSLSTDDSEADAASVYPSISGDGRFVAFASDAPNLVPGDTNQTRDIFVRDTCFGAAEACAPSIVRVSVRSDGLESDLFNEVGSLSADGHFVAFHSYASNLVPGDVPWSDDVFLARTGH